MFSTLLPKLFGYFMASLADKHVPSKTWSAFRSLLSMPFFC